MRRGRRAVAARANTALLLLLAALLTLAQPAVASSTSRPPACPRVVVELDVAVVGFNVTGLELLNGSRRAYDVLVGPCTLVVDVSVTSYAAPAELVGSLAAGLAAIYEDRGTPEWLPGVVRRPVKWVWLPSYEELAYGLAVEVAGQHDYYIVIVGDVDGVSRQPYYVFYHAVLGRVVEVSGVRVWTSSLRPLTLVDLTVVPRPWPSGVPLEGLGRRVDPLSEVYPWGGTAAAVPRYVAEVVWGIVESQLVGPRRWLPEGVAYPARLELKLVVLLHDEAWGVARDVILDPLLAEYIARAVRTVYPSGALSVEVVVERLDAYPALERAVEGAARDVDGYLVVVYEEVRGAVEAIVAEHGGAYGGGEWVYIFVLLVGPGPLKLYIRSLDEYATAVTEGPFAFGVFPGRDGRMLRGGVSTAVAHELGHSLGEAHAFETRRGIDWRLDFAATVMSYYDPAAAAAAASPAYSSPAHPLLARTAARMLATLLQEGLLDPLTYAELAASVYSDPRAVIEELERLMGAAPAAVTVTATVATTVTVSREVVRTVTVLSEVTRTVTAYATATEGEPPGRALAYYALGAALIALLAAALARRRGRG